jgi:hypothetical protein
MVAAVKPIVFAGPSLHGAALGSSGLFDLAPPAACGDVMRAVIEGRDVIGLIDGVFETGPAVWHKEILFALGAGRSVIGAASMGALRAAECVQFGMVGVGSIFEDFRTGRRSSDADVALVHGPAELRYVPLSVPLVDVDDCLDRMLDEGAISSGTAVLLASRARKLHFKKRTWERLLEASEITLDDQERIFCWICTSGPSSKTRDALQLLEVILDPPRAESVPVPFVHTRFSERLLHTMKVKAGEYR